MIAAAFRCAKCGRHRVGSSAQAASEGVVCAGGCASRACRCQCCDDYCDSEACAFFRGFRFTPPPVRKTGFY